MKPYWQNLLHNRKYIICGISKLYWDIIVVSLGKGLHLLAPHGLVRWALWINADHCTQPAAGGDLKSSLTFLRIGESPLLSQVIHFGIQRAWVSFINVHMGSSYWSYACICSNNYDSKALYSTCFIIWRWFLDCSTSENQEQWGFTQTLVNKQHEAPNVKGEKLKNKLSRVTILFCLRYVLLKEKNMLLTIEQEAKRQRLQMPSPERLRKVSETTKRIESNYYSLQQMQYHYCNSC